jgi:RimJ/RimL family protein N-acetyltransferase
MKTRTRQTGRMHTRLRTTIRLLTLADEADVLAFELANRAFFAAAVGDRGLTRITAKTTSNNAASRRVLERSGFVRQPTGTPSHLTVGEVEYPAVHYARDTRSA